MSGDAVGLILVMGVSGSTKCPVTPASTMAMYIAILILLVLKMVSEFSDCVMLRRWKIYFHALALVANDSLILHIGVASDSMYESSMRG